MTRFRRCVIPVAGWYNSCMCCWTNNEQTKNRKDQFSEYGMDFFPWLLFAHRSEPGFHHLDEESINPAVERSDVNSKDCRQASNFRRLMFWQGVASLCGSAFWRLVRHCWRMKQVNPVVNLDLSNMMKSESVETIFVLCLPRWSSILAWFVIENHDSIHERTTYMITIYGVYILIKCFLDNRSKRNKRCEFANALVRIYIT